MTQACPPEHERWLVEALSAGATALDASARAQLEGCPRCAPEWAELRALQATLAGSAGEERAALAQAEREAGAEEERFVRAALATKLGRRAPRLRRLAPWLLLAAAAAAGLFLLTRPRQPAVAPPEQTLAGQPITILEGVGFDSFEWTDDGSGASGYHVEVWPTDGDDSLFGQYVEASPLLLGKDVTALWPESVLVLVTPVDGAHQPVGTTASISRPRSRSR